jgi:hypothetical protein
MRFFVGKFMLLFVVAENVYVFFKVFLGEKYACAMWAFEEFVIVSFLRHVFRLMDVYVYFLAVKLRLVPFSLNFASTHM